MKKSAPSPRPVFRRDFLENVFGLLAATGLGASLSAADRQPAYATAPRRIEGRPPDFPPKLRITKLGGKPKGSCVNS